MDTYALEQKEYECLHELELFGADLLSLEITARLFLLKQKFDPLSTFTLNTAWGGGWLGAAGGAGWYGGGAGAGGGGGCFSISSVGTINTVGCGGFGGAGSVVTSGGYHTITVANPVPFVVNGVSNVSSFGSVSTASPYITIPVVP